jgi:hypothetical protein
MKLLVAVTMAHSAPVSRWTVDQAPGAVGQTRPDLPGHELGVPGVQLCATMARQRCELKIQELVDVERPGLVLLVEVRVACLVELAVQHALRDEELRPLEVRVAGEQRVVEVEKHQFHCQ